MDAGNGLRIDESGRLLVPADLRDRLGLAPGMTLIVEGGSDDEVCLRVAAESPCVVDKGGVLVVTSQPHGDIVEAVEQERSRRASELIRQADL